MSYTSRIPSLTASLGKVINESLRELAADIERDAKARVPVDSGKLRDAIHIEREDGGYLVVAGDSGVFYGHLVEFGTTHTGARPFLIPAVEGQRGSVLGRVASRFGAL